MIKQIGLMVIGMAALLCTVPALFVGAFAMVTFNTFLVFPIPAFCMVALGWMCFWKAELI